MIRESFLLCHFAARVRTWGERVLEKMRVGAQRPVPFVFFHFVVVLPLSKTFIFWSIDTRQDERWQQQHQQQQ
jgi:hypothetical protein